MSATPAGKLSADTSPAERVGCTGDFDLGEPVGAGGMGVVYRAHDLGLDRALAVKVVRPEHQDRPEQVRRFLAEARIVAQLQHPGIPPVHGRGQLPDGRPFFTMKLIRGETLLDLLRSRLHPAEELPRFVGIFAQVCQAVTYAHSRGILHRDIKPHNVMVGAFGEVQLLDWAMAKELQPGGEETTDALPSLVLDGSIPPGAADTETVDLGPAEESSGGLLKTKQGQAMGTLAYMPPEQARGEVSRVDERSDEFGLGAILCEVLTGQPPFRGDNALQVLDKAKACDHAAALAALDSCGADAELVRLKACLAARPADQPHNAREVAEEVKAYLAGVQERLQAAERERAAAEARVQEARRTVAAERTARRWMVRAALGVLLVSTIGLATTYWQYREADGKGIG